MGGRGGALAVRRLGSYLGRGAVGGAVLVGDRGGRRGVAGLGWEWQGGGGAALMRDMWRLCRGAWPVLRVCR